MHIVNFEKEHLVQAQQLALENYREERTHVPILPEITAVPDLAGFAKNDLGVVAFEGDSMVGFLLSYSPRENFFDTPAIGLFTPMHAHGAVKLNRERIYKRMYQAAADKWVQKKITYHAIALYAHDEAAIHAFFTYGFGLRCLDAIRPMENFECTFHEDVTFHELKDEDKIQLRTLRRLKEHHFGQSPCFMYSTEEQFNEWLKETEHDNNRVFAAKDGDQCIAYVEIRDEAETFITSMPGMTNICGAYCMSEYRGKNIMQRLLNYMIAKLKDEGYVRIGVDFEGFNPTASAFWPKNFQVYTNSLVRRIDECALHD